MKIILDGMNTVRNGSYIKIGLMIMIILNIFSNFLRIMIEK